MAAGELALQRDVGLLLGPDSWLTRDEDTAPFLTDHRRLYRGRALGVALPRDTAEAARLLGWCNEQGVGVVPQGGNTGYCGGATPDDSGGQLVLSLRRLNRIRSIDAENFSMVAEAGCVLAHVQHAAAAAERFFPLSLGSEGSCQIGGNLATNAGGVNVVRYGMTRDLVLGVEAVLPDGRIYAGLKSLRKDNTGYDLRSLFIGSEGTLGLITAASLKLWPRQRTSATAFAAIPTVAAAVQLLGMLRAAAADRLSSFELLPRIAVDLTTRHIPNVTDPFTRRYDWYILCELTSAADEPLDEILQETLGAAIERSVVLDAALSSSERQRQAFWRLREHIPEAQRLAGPSLKHDISVPVAALPRFVAEASAAMAVQAPDGVLVCYGHAGDGNLHFNISHLDDANNAGFLARESLIRRTVHDLVASYQGSISAEHGIGRLKREELQRYGSPVGLDCMRAIKRALDPNGIMNPGKLL